MNKIWVGSPSDVRYDSSAENALNIRNDKHYWTEEEGIVRVDESRWREAQEFERSGWIEHWRNDSADRPMDHYNLLDGYKSVKQNLGVVVEYGCGPFTQIKHIAEYGKRNIDGITLLDPLIEHYPSMPHCTYKNNMLLGKPVERIASQAEKFLRPNYYDTAVCINVLEHVQDAWIVLNNIFTNLKVGGTLILGERTYDDFDCNSLFDIGHPIRIKSSVTDKFRSNFEVLFGTTGYFIGIKK